MGVSGGKGEGPGEFDSPAYLARGEEGTVGVHDLGLGRFTVFEPSGAYLSEVLAPMVDVPLRSFGTVLSGVEADIMVMLGYETSGSLMTRYDVNLATGEVVREEASRGPGMLRAGKSPGACRTGPGDGCSWPATVIFVRGACADLPRELPDERDVARHEEGIMAFNRMRGLPASESVDEELESYRATPKRYFLGTEHQLVDAANRLDRYPARHAGSYLDVYEKADYVVGEGSGPAEGLRPPGVDPGGRSSDRSTQTMPTGLQTGPWIGTTLETCPSAGDPDRRSRGARIHLEFLVRLYTTTRSTPTSSRCRARRYAAPNSSGVNSRPGRKWQ